MHEETTGRDDLKHLDAENQERIEKYLACIEQMERLIRIRCNLSGSAAPSRSATGPIAAEIQGLRIGDFVLVTFPGELFAEVACGSRSSRRSSTRSWPATRNGHLGYAPTADAYDERGLRRLLTPLRPRVAGDLRGEGAGDHPPPAFLRQRRMITERPKLAANRSGKQRFIALATASTPAPADRRETATSRRCSTSVT